MEASAASGTRPAPGAARGPASRLLSATMLHVALLAAACFLVYSNAYEHEFQLDSDHVVRTNRAIRSLGNVGRFFTDAGTFTSLKPNVDYRPVLVVSHALDYALDGLAMRQWHRTQVLIHLACVLGLYALCRRIQTLVEGTSGAGARLVALAAALVFAVHPANCGVVDYVSARSSMLTAAFLLPALLAYTGGLERYERAQWGAALLYALALFTKVEAIGALAVFFLFDVWRSAARAGHARGFVHDVLVTLRSVRGWLRRMWPLLVVTGVYWVLRTRAMSEFAYEEASRRADVTNVDYLRTQVVAWWHYVARWLVATEYIADDTTFHVYRSFAEPGFLLALGAWGLVAAALVGSWRRAPHLAFLAASALALISPTSSLVPLAEMVNEHRPYLPLALLSLAWTIPLGRAVRAGLLAGAPSRALGAAAWVVLVLGLGSIAYERNTVFLTTESYWRDIVEKVPRPNGRALVNYGRTFLARGEAEQALDYFLRSLETTPYWHISHANLAVAYEELGQVEKAREHHDLAVAYDSFSGTSLTCRGEFRLGQGEWAAAAEDFRASGAKSLERYRNARGLATALAGQADAEGCLAATRECLALDPAQLAADIVRISTPFFAFDAEGRIASRERVEAGLRYFELLLEDLPAAWWVHANLATLAGHLGRRELEDLHRARAAALREAERRSREEAEAAGS